MSEITKPIFIIRIPFEPEINNNTLTQVIDALNLKAQYNLFYIIEDREKIDFEMYPPELIEPIEMEKLKVKVNQKFSELTVK